MVRLVRFAMWMLPVALASATAWGSALEPRLFDPMTFTSPGGMSVLKVDPSRRGGSGPATYVMRRGGEVAWSSTLPFTLVDAVVADDGVVGGVAYSDGKEANSGDLVVAFLGADGRVLRTEPHERGKAPVVDLHATTGPYSHGLLFDPLADRFVVRVTEQSEDETWWIYRLHDGVRLGRVTPASNAAQGDRLSFVGARVVPGTSLTLAQWLRWNGEDTGARFALLDADGKPTWELDLPRDYMIGDEFAQARLVQEIFADSAILAVGERTFQLHHMTGGQRVTYEMLPTGVQAGWRVMETARAPYVAPVAAVARVPDAPATALRHLGTVTLESGLQAATSPVRNVYDFRIDDRGRFGFLVGCDCSKAQPFVIVDRDGGLVREWILPSPANGNYAELHAIWLADERWLVITSGSGNRVPATAVFLDVDTGAVTPVADFVSPSVKAATRTPDGGFVVIASDWGPYGSTETLRSFDRDGHEQWQVAVDGGGSKEPGKLFSPEDVAVTADGTVVVLENVTDRLLYLTADGQWLRTVELETKWKTPANYPSAVRPDENGGVIVHDFQGKAPIVRMQSNDSVLSAWRPLREDGGAFDIHGGVQVAHDGTLWTSDGHSLLQLDSNGRVTRTVGAVHDPDSLGRVVALVIDPHRRVLAMDARTGAIHAFDENGKRLRVMKPLPDDYSDSIPDFPSLTATSAGDVWVTRQEYGDGTFLHYGPSGKRIGIEAGKLDSVTEDWVVQPDGVRRWVLGHEDVFLADVAGDKAHRIERMGSGRWIGSPSRPAMAADGALAFISGYPDTATSSTTEDMKGAEVQVLGPDGTPLHTWPAPPRLVYWNGALAFDGERLAFLLAGEGKDDRHSVLVTSADGTPLQHAVLAHAAERVFLVDVDGRRELWVHAGDRRVERYAVP